MPPDQWSNLIGVLFNNGAWGILVALLVLDARYFRKRLEERDEELRGCYENSVKDAKSRRGINPEGDTQRGGSKTFSPGINDEERKEAIKRMNS